MHRRQKKCYICKRKFSTDDNNKKYHKVKDHCHYTEKCRAAAHDICNLRYKIPKEILIVFHNGSTYDYHFMIKKLAEKFEEELEYLDENTEKYIAFTVPIKKEITKTDKDGSGKIMKVSYKIKFIDSFRFMSSSLSKSIDNLFEGFHSDKCAVCKSYLDYMSIKDNQLIFRFLSVKRMIRKTLIKN